MGVRRGDGRCPQPVADAVVPVQVAAPGGRQTTALQQHTERTERSDGFGRTLHAGLVFDRQSAEQAGLVDVGREQVGQGKQQRHQGRDRLGLEQNRASAGHHHRINHPGNGQRRDCQRCGDDTVAVEQHAGLEGSRRQIPAHRFNLGRHCCCGQRIQPLHPQGVLSRNAGQGRTAMHPQHRECFEIGLDAGTTAGITAADREREGGQQATHAEIRIIPHLIAVYRTPSSRSWAGRRNCATGRNGNRHEDLGILLRLLLEVLKSRQGRGHPGVAVEHHQQKATAFTHEFPPHR